MKIHFKTFAATALSLVLAAVLVGGFALAGAPKASQADTIVGTRSITLVSVSGVSTSSVTSDAYYTQFYGSADCFGIYVAGDIAGAGAPTTTTKLQVSPDGVNWADIIGMTAQSAASTVLTRTALAGAYLRSVSTVQISTPPTYTVKCVLKNAST